MKIAIIGNAGSGKSTLALQLHQLLTLPIYHLDQYFWKPNWQEPEPAEFEKIHHQLCDQPTWIIEGIATRLFEYRAAQADIIIFINISRYRCLYRVFKRAILNFGKVRDTSAKGCPEIMPSKKFLKFIWTFDKERKPLIEALMQKYKDRKHVFVIRNKKGESD